MKKNHFFYFAFLIFTLTAVRLFAAYNAGGQVTFIIDILGSDSFDDIRIIQDTLRDSDGVLKISISSTEKNFARLEGLTTSSKDNLINDIRGLALNRFEMETAVKATDAGPLIFVTLRKMPSCRNNCAKPDLLN